MTVPAVEYDDLELWVCGYLRPKLPGVNIDRRFPVREWVPGYAVVVRDDSGPDVSVATASRLLGVTIIGPESGYAPTAQLAQRVATLLRTSIIPGPSSPIADCRIRGPYSLESPRTEFYLTAELVAVGHPVTL